MSVALLQACDFCGLGRFSSASQKRKSATGQSGHPVVQPLKVVRQFPVHGSQEGSEKYKWPNRQVRESGPVKKRCKFCGRKFADMLFLVGHGGNSIYAPFNNGPTRSVIRRSQDQLSSWL